MKKSVKLALTAACCISAAFSSVLPASAAEQTEPENNLIYADTVCPDFEPNGSDMIVFNGCYSNPVKIKIVQHSPERENLLLYDTAAKLEKEDMLLFRAEPGSYTISVSTPDIFNSASYCTYTQDFTIENPDYADETQPYQATEYLFFGKYLKTADSEESAAQVLTTDQMYAQNNNRFIVSLGFPRYGRLRGDYNGDGVADLADAQLTLREYGKVLSGKKTDTEPGVLAACDITGDGVIDVADAQQILMYYAEAMANKIPHWKDGTTSEQYDAAYTDRSCIYPGDTYAVEMRLVPYFSDDVPETEEERSTLIASANKLLKTDVQMHLSFSEPDSSFYVNGSESKTCELTYAPKLGETASFTIFNSSKIYPETCSLNDSMIVKTDGLSTKQRSTSFRCETFRFDQNSDPAYYCGCFAEYNVNTNKFRVWKYQTPGTELHWEQTYE